MYRDPDCYIELYGCAPAHTFVTNSKHRARVTPVNLKEAEEMLITHQATVSMVSGTLTPVLLNRP
jgi:hypothetical protein